MPNFWSPIPRSNPTGQVTICSSKKPWFQPPLEVHSGYVKIAIEKMTIEIVDIPMKHGDVPVRFFFTFTRG